MVRVAKGTRRILDADKRLAAHAYQDGKSGHKAAKKYGMSSATLYKFMRSKKIKTRPRARFDAAKERLIRKERKGGATIRTLAKRHKIACCSIFRIVGKGSHR